jgi:hypothetical protein
MRFHDRALFGDELQTLTLWTAPGTDFTGFVAHAEDPGIELAEDRLIHRRGADPHVVLQEASACHRGAALAAGQAGRRFRQAPVTGAADRGRCHGSMVSYRPLPDGLPSCKGRCIWGDHGPDAHAPGRGSPSQKGLRG